MILQCPECQARFAVPDALIPPAGRTVKCGRCAHQWHAGGITAEDNSDFAGLVAGEIAQSPAANPSQLPVIQKPPFSAKPLIIATPLIALVWIGLALLAYYPHWLNAPVAKSLYKTFGIVTTEGLVFNDVRMTKNQLDLKTQYILSGSIANHAAIDRVIPVVRVQLKDKNSNVLWAREYEVNETVKAGDAYAFRIDNIETSFGKSIATIVLDLGNPLQLTMR